MMAEYGEFEVYLVKPNRSFLKFTTTELLPHYTRDKTLGAATLGASSVPGVPPSALDVPGSRGPAALSTVGQLPAEVMDWSVAHVLLWLDAVLELPQYQHRFRKASVDGPVLLRLNSRDLQQLLGVREPLHLRKFSEAVRVRRRPAAAAARRSLHSPWQAAQPRPAPPIPHPSPPAQVLKRRAAMLHGSPDRSAVPGRQDWTAPEATHVYAQAMDQERIALIGRLKEVFDAIDTDRNGVLTVDELYRAFRLMGREDSLEEVRASVPRVLALVCESGRSSPSPTPCPAHPPPRRRSTTGWRSATRMPAARSRSTSS